MILTSDLISSPTQLITQGEDIAKSNIPAVKTRPSFPDKIAFKNNGEIHLY